MIGIDRAQAAAYLNRWQILAAQELADLRSTSLEQKFQQLSALFASRALFPDDAPADPESDAVRDRWARIRAACRV
jgi:hypothetical protein